MITNKKTEKICAVSIMQQRNKDIKFIGVPFRSGANREGTQLAPKWLIEHMSLPEEVCSHLQFKTEDTPLSDTEINGVKNYNAVLRMISAVRTEVLTAISNRKKAVIVGGDHSIAIGSITGVLECFPNLGVIWFDAHTDINTEASSPSGNAHGMPLAALMGLCDSEINNNSKRLNPANVFWVGARDVDKGEWEIIKRLGIEDNVYTSEMIHRIDMKVVMNDIRTKLKAQGVEHLHLSFDIDGMDPLIVQATGTPVKMGLNEIGCDTFINELGTGMPLIISLDFVEYNPMMDDNINSTGGWCLRTLKQLIDIL